jgi:hypothetical protein
MEEGEGVSGGLHANFAIWEGSKCKIYGQDKG